MNLAAAMLCLVVGCSEHRRAGSPEEFGLIDAAFTLTIDTVIAADRLKERTIASCMQQQGFLYLQKDNAAYLQSTDVAATRYLTNSRVSSEWYGFRNLEAFTELPTDPPDPNQAMINSMSPVDRAAFLTALNVGTTHEACTAQGEAAAADAIVGPATLKLGKLNGEVLARVNSAPSVQHAKTLWRTCMIDRGIRAESRDQIIVDLKTAADAAQAAASPSQAHSALLGVQDRAKATAAADAACDAQAGLEQETRQRRTATERALLAENPGLLEEVQREKSRLTG